MWDAYQDSLAALLRLPARVGLYNHALATEHVLAFAMLLHTRLGQQSGLCCLPEELVRRVLRTSWPAGPAGALEGLARLLGGGTAV